MCCSFYFELNGFGNTKKVYDALFIYSMERLSYIYLEMHMIDLIHIV